MIRIDSNYLLLPISVDVRFGSLMGELSGSHHLEEEVAQYQVPATLCIQLDWSNCNREWPDIALQQVVICALCHSLLASELWGDAPGSIQNNLFEAMHNPERTSGFLACLHFTEGRMPSNYTVESLIVLYELMRCKYFYSLIHTILQSLKSL